MPQLALSYTFFGGWESLAREAKAGVHKAVEKFRQLTVAELHADKGVHLEAVENARDPRLRTIRITRSLRGVVLAPDAGDGTFLLVNVLPHDAAYDWARKRLFTVNAATGALEMRDVATIDALRPELERANADVHSRLFAAHSDGALRHLGIDTGLLPAVRTITDEQQLQAFERLFPEDQYEVLLHLATGSTPEEVWREVVAAGRAPDQAAPDTEDVAAAIANTPSRITVISDERELTEALTRPFAAWRVFLHPSQRRVAYRASYAGPAQLTGGPGTGKTVVALHRVRHLLQRTAGTDSRVLLTTFTTALAASLRENLAQLLGPGSPLLERVEVATVNALAHRVVREARGRVPELVGDADERAYWQRVRRRLDLPWTEQFLAQEYRHVVLAQDLTSERGYLAARRRGRGSRLPAAQRPLLWRAMAEFERMLREEGKRTHLQLCARAAALLRAADQPPGAGDGGRFRHVVVDEAQDLHPAQWRVLRAAVPPGPDDLFVTGDPHQRIYDSRVSLGSLGISVAGRSHRLRLNYRSTEEILRFSARLLTGERVDAIAGEGAADTLDGYRSRLRGERPSAVGYDSERAELDALADRVVAWIGAGIGPAEIAVCCRFGSTGGRIVQRLAARGVPAVLARSAGPGQDAVRVATMHAMKGLEFRCVAVVGAHARALPFPNAVTPVEVDRLQHEADLLAERCLLFVACTRARESLRVSWSGPPSPFLTALLAVAGGGDPDP